jgi:O-antigen ligase
MGSGIPDLDITRLAALLLVFRLLAQAVLPWIARREPAHVSASAAADAAMGLAPFTWPDAAMIAFTVAIALSTLTSWLGPISGLQTVFDFVFAPMLICYLARNWLSSPRAIRWTVGVVALTGVLLGVITIREQLTGETLFSPVWYSLAYELNIRRVLSLFGNPATMSAALAITVPWQLYGLQQAGTFNKRLLLGLALIVTLAGAFFVYVRAGWLGALLGIGVMILLSPATRRGLLPFLPVVAVVGLVVFLVTINPNVVQQRLSSEQPITYRLQAWEIAWDIFRQSPLLGAGYDNFGQLASAQYGWNPHISTMVTTLPAVHNSYLYVLVSGGLLALTPYVGILVALAWRGLLLMRGSRPGDSEQRELAATLWATVLSYAVMIGTFDAINSQYFTMLFFLIAGALLGRLERLHRFGISEFGFGIWDFGSEACSFQIRNPQFEIRNEVPQSAIRHPK